MAKGSREQSTLRYFKEADIEMAEVVLEAATRVVERRSKDTTAATAPTAARGRKTGTKNAPAQPAQPKPDTRQGELPGTQEPTQVPSQVPQEQEEREAAYATR